MTDERTLDAALPQKDPYGGEAEGTAQLAAEKLWTLLKARAKRYAMGDHSSLPEKRMEELLRSIVMTLELGGCSGEALATADLERAFSRGQAELARLTARAQRLWREACLRAPEAYTASYRDTLKSIGDFFRRYDRDFFAHDIPCDIDYQLFRPVQEGLPGVCYIEAYLRRILSENEILRAFDGALVKRLFSAYCGDDDEQVVNLCEPVAINALGLTLLAADARALDISDAQRAALAGRFRAWDEREARRRLADAARSLCDTLALQSAAARADLAWLAGELLPRIAAALPYNELDGIFLTLA